MNRMIATTCMIALLGSGASFAESDSQIQAEAEASAEGRAEGALNRGE